MPEQQCPVCGQKMDSAAPFCPHCGAPIAQVMKSAPPLLTNMKWLDALVGMFIEGGLLATTATASLRIIFMGGFSWVVVLILILLVTGVAYFLIRRKYPFVARGLIIGCIVGLALILGIFRLCSGYTG